MDYGSSPYFAPRLTLRVGVTGHRTGKLEGHDSGRIARKAAEALGFIRRSVEALAAENDALGADAPYQVGVPPSLRMVTALAAGADSIVAEAAIGEGYDLNIVLPYPAQTYRQDFSPAELVRFDLLWAHDAPATTRTELDMSGKPGDPEAYRAAGHLMLAHVDVLIAVWDGAPAAGAGGTEEILAEACRRGLTVITISPEGEMALWQAPETAADPYLDGSRVPIDLDGPTGDALRVRVRQALELPEGRYSDESHHGRPEVPSKALESFRDNRTRAGSYAVVYSLLKSTLLGRPRFALRVDYSTSNRAADGHWRRIEEVATEIGGAAMAERIEHSIRRRWEAADNLANHYANLYRSAFVGNFFLAAAAVFVGLLIVFPLGHDSSRDLLDKKAALVSIELVFIGIILVKTYLGNREGWHRRWLDYRSLAESLRPARLHVLAGSSPARPGTLVGATPGEAWVAWYVRASLREIVPPDARLDAEALRKVLMTARDCEIDSQIAYHRQNSEQMQRLEHRLELIAQLLFLCTFLSGALFLAFYAVHTVKSDNHLAHDVKPWVTFLGGTLPVLGAAIFGIRATGDFRSSARQSKRMLAELERLRGIVDAELAEPRRQDVVRVLGLASRVISEDLKLWGMIYSERALEAGF